MTQHKLSRPAWIRAALAEFEARLLRYATSITGNADLARDVVQDTFLRLCAADRAKVEGHLAPWLYTVCRNRALDVRKKEGRMNPLAEGQAEALADSAAGPGDVATQKETQRLVMSAMAGLPQDQREACRLKFQDNLSYREISQVMDVSLGTVSNLITRAMSHVRAELGARLDLAREV